MIPWELKVEPWYLFAWVALYGLEILNYLIICKFLFICFIKENYLFKKFFFFKT